MLPGIEDEDIDRFASGSVFRKLNCVDFRTMPFEADSLRKLYLALTGSSDEQIARRGLTPYILRRDASRWRERGRKDRSLLYSGAKLVEAQDMLETAGDLLDVGEVAAFLRAGADRQRRFWQAVLLATFAAALSLLAAASVAIYQGGLAHDRQLLAVSRGLALEADVTRGAREQLLVAAHAVQVAATATARAKLMEKLDSWKTLAATLQLQDSEFTAATYLADSHTILLGTADGSLVEATIKFDNGQAGDVTFMGSRTLFRVRGEGEIRCIIAQVGGPKLIGFQSGRVLAVEPDGRQRTLRSAPAPVRTEAGSMKDRTVLAMALSPAGDRVAIGDARGVLEIRDIQSSELTLPAFDLSDQLRVNAITFLKHDRIAVGTGTGNIEVFDSRSAQSIANIPRQGSEVINLAEGRGDGEIVEITDEGMVRTLIVDAHEHALLSDPRGNMFQVPPLLVQSKIDTASGAMALGYPDGVMEVRDSVGSEILGRMQPHRDQVGAFVFIPDVRLLVSAGRDGVVAVWRLDSQLSIARPISHFSGGYVEMISVDRENMVFVLSRNADDASIWQLGPAGWVQVLSLLEDSAKVLGGDDLVPARTPDAEGFVNVSSQPIESVALAVDVRTALWTTQNGAVLSHVWSSGALPVLHFEANQEIGDLALSSDGRLAAVLEGSRRITLFRPSSSKKQDQRTVELDSDARSIGLSDDASILAVGMKNGELLLYDIKQSKQAPFRRIVLGVEIASVLFTPDGRALLLRGATVGKDSRALAIIDTSKLHEVRYLPMPEALTGALTSLTISRDGKLLAAPDAGGNVLLWDLEERKSVGTSFFDSSPISALALDPTGNAIAAISVGDNIVKLAISPNDMIKRVCDLAGRDLDEREWADLETGLAYSPTCIAAAASAP